MMLPRSPLAAMRRRGFLLRLFGAALTAKRRGTPFAPEPLRRPERRKQKPTPTPAISAPPKISNL